MDGVCESTQKIRDPPGQRHIPTTEAGTPFDVVVEASCSEISGVGPARPP